MISLLGSSNGRIEDSDSPDIGSSPIPKTIIMKFRYDFAEKLDLTRFKKQAPHYISLGRESSFEIYVRDFRINVEIATPDNQNAHQVILGIEEIKRDEDGEIITAKIIYPNSDTRFKEIKDIQKIFNGADYKSYFNSNSSTMTVDNISNVIRIVHKINNLKAFI